MHNEAMSRRIRRTVAGAGPALAITLGLVVATACSGGSAATTAPGGGSSAGPAASQDAGATQAPAASQAPGAALDVCSMLSIADVKTVTGADTTATVESTSGWADWVAGQCWWNNANMSVRFSLDLGTPASIAKSSSPTAAEQLALFKVAMKGFGDVVDVPGLGDGAVYVAGFLVATKGGSMVQVYATALTQDQVIALGKLAVAKL